VQVSGCGWGVANLGELRRYVAPAADSAICASHFTQGPATRQVAIQTFKPWFMVQRLSVVLGAKSRVAGVAADDVPTFIQ
jgi:hypothetical protein